MMGKSEGVAKDWNILVYPQANWNGPFILWNIPIKDGDFHSYIGFPEGIPTVCSFISPVTSTTERWLTCQSIIASKYEVLVVLVLSPDFSNFLGGRSCASRITARHSKTEWNPG